MDMMNVDAALPIPGIAASSGTRTTTIDTTATTNHDLDADYHLNRSTILRLLQSQLPPHFKTTGWFKIEAWRLFSEFIDVMLSTACRSCQRANRRMIDVKDMPQVFPLTLSTGDDGVVFLKKYRRTKNNDINAADEDVIIPMSSLEDREEHEAHTIETNMKTVAIPIADDFARAATLAEHHNYLTDDTK
jgi:hypothetical protein